MKKVGILTLNDAINYGALFQMYSLYVTLFNENFEVQIINYEDNVINNRYRLFLKRKSIKSNIKELLFMPSRILEQNSFSSFKKKMNFSRRVNNDTIKELEFDAVIAGSDQIWNLTLTNNNYTYFLDWFQGDKYSYAASFGINQFDWQFESAISHLIDYKAISVRENNALSFLQRHSIDAIQNIDPIFLLDSKYWRDIAIRPNECNDYILIYTIGYSNEIIDFARELAEKNNLRVLLLSDDILYKRGIKIIRGSSPEKWLGYFYYARYIITNSFHGTAFSIAFNKEFYCDNVKTTLKDTNTRIESLLQVMGIGNRNINNGRIDDIDWSEVNMAIKRERERSFHYLSKI